MGGKPKKSPTTQQTIDQQYQITEYFQSNQVLLSSFESNNPIFCPICVQDLQFLSYNQRNSHVNECMSDDSMEISDISIVERNTIKSKGNPSSVELLSEETEQTMEMTTISKSSVEKAVKKPAKRRASGNGTDAKKKRSRGNAESKLTEETSHVGDEPSELKPDIKSTEPKNIPFFKILDFPGNKKIAVDAFCYGPIPEVSSYFLTHFHSDHYGGLRKSWSNGHIYCSEATARLVKLRLNVSDDWLRPLPMNKIVEIDDIEVLLLDANHCPGSTIMLFRYKNHSILHTGDFRACQKQIDLLHTLHPSKLDIIYLDTTYLHPKHCLPTQNSVIDACTKYCLKLRDMGGEPPSTMLTLEGFMSLVGLRARAGVKANPIIFVGSYVIGKERLAVNIAKYLGSKIFPSGPDKAQVLGALEDNELNELLTDDGLNCNVHLVSMRELDSERLAKHWKALKSRFTHMVVFSPTGWNYYASKAQIDKSEPAPFGLRQLETCRTITEGGKVHILRVPYSEHSSFPELRRFIEGVPAKTVIPTVNMSQEYHRENMRYWIEKWRSKRETQ